MRYTIIVPEHLIDDTNHLSAVIGNGPDDAATFGRPAWRDSEGNAYAVASFEAPADWITILDAPPVRPAWDETETIDMMAAKRAQEVLIKVGPDAETLQTDILQGIAVLVGCAPAEALHALGMTYPEDPE